MKELILIAAFCFSSMAAATETKVIDCQGPAGGEVTFVSGTIQITLNSTGQMTAEGKIDTNFSNAPIEVSGAYDDIGGFEYATLGTTTASDINLLYVNFDDSEDQALSYIEIQGHQHPLNCGTN